MDKMILRLVYAYHGNGIILYVLITTLIACVLSSVIGLERQLRGEPAGVRTHALLALGSSLLMTLSIWAIRIADGSLDIIMQTIDNDLNYDTSRIAAAVITGIGFLGGGVIVKDKFSVKGLSTASTLWLCTAIGLACGAGFILEAIIFTAVVLLMLILLGKVLDYIDDKSPSVVIACLPGYPIVEKLRELSEGNGLSLKKTNILKCDDDNTVVKASFIYNTDMAMLKYLSKQMQNIKEITEISCVKGKKQKENQ